MHPDEFKYFTLDSADDWKQGYYDKIEISEDGSLALWSVPNLETTVPLPDSAAYPVGLAFKEPDTLFVIDKNKGSLFQFNIITQELNQIRCINKSETVTKQFLTPGGIAVSNTMLYIVDSGFNRVLALFLHNYQIRFILGALDECNQPTSGRKLGTFNNPTDVALDSKENLYVVDQNNKRIQKFNKQGQFITQFGQIGEEKLGTPTNIAIDKQDFIYILDKDKSYFLRFDSKGAFINRIGDFSQIPAFQPAGLAIDSKNKLYVGEAADGENQKIYMFENKGVFLGNCPGYRGPCNCLTVDRQDNLYVGFQTNNSGQLAVLNSGKTFLPGGTYYSNVFDSTIKNCRWHRLALDVLIPSKTRVEIFYFLAENLVTMETIRALPPSKWYKTFVNADDLLFQSGSGRYLWLKINLYGDEYQTPNIRSLTIYFPRLSYLRYLPAIYQEDEVSKNFLERFLSLFETFFIETEKTIAAIACYFDPLAIDEKFVNWLALWLAIAADENWQQQKKRIFISQAYQLFKKRGTKQGLEDIIELYTSTKPFIIEHFNLMTPMILGQGAILGQKTILGKKTKKPLVLGPRPLQCQQTVTDAKSEKPQLISENSTLEKFALYEKEPGLELPFKSYAYDFTIIISSLQLTTETQINTVKRIIEEEKPAHTSCYLRIAGSEMRIGYDSYIELSTIVAREAGTMQLGPRSIIGRDTFLMTEKLLKGDIGSHSQVGVSTIIN